MTFRQIIFRRQPAGDSPSIHRLHLELAPTEVRVVQWVQRALVLGSLTACAVIGWWGWDRLAVEETAATYERAAASMERATKEFVGRMQDEHLVFTPDQAETIREQVTFANHLSDKRAFSWTQMLSDLEATVPPHVALANIKLNFQESVIVLEGTAVRLQDVNAFITQLHAHQAFRDAVLDRHEIRHEHPGKDTGGDAPIEFRLSVLYRPPL